MQDDLSLEQLVSFPTRGEKTLDLVFTTHPSLVDKCKPLPSVGKSDHDIVLVDLCISPTIAKMQQKKMFMWKKANNNAIRTPNCPGMIIGRSCFLCRSEIQDGCHHRS
jgi:hypothetical protein